MADRYEVDEMTVPLSLPVVAQQIAGMQIIEMSQQPVQPVQVNPNYGRKMVPSTAIIERVMRDRSSFIGSLVSQHEQGGK